MPSGKVTNDSNHMSNVFVNAFASVFVWEKHHVLVGSVDSVMDTFYLSVEAGFASAKLSVYCCPSILFLLDLFIGDSCPAVERFQL